jgi:hypothetical protein
MSTQVPGSQRYGETEKAKEMRVLVFNASCLQLNKATGIYGMRTF